MLNGNKHRIYMDNNSMKVYFDDKHIYTMDRFSGLGYVYVLGDIFMFADYGSCSTIGLKIFDENKELNIEPLNWDDNVIKYNFSTIEKIEIENNNPVIYYTFDTADCGAEISLANGEKFNPNFADSEELGIKGDQIISGNAKITYLGNKKFSEVQVLTGKTYSEIFE